MTEVTILRRPDASTDTDCGIDRARVLRYHAQRAALIALYKPQTSRIIGTATAITSASSGRPSRQ